MLEDDLENRRMIVLAGNSRLDPPGSAYYYLSPSES